MFSCAAEVLHLLADARELAVASLPGEEQVAAAAAGKDELKQAAKRVRESRRKPRSESAAIPRQEAAGSEDTVESLQHRVATLTVWVAGTKFAVSHHLRWRTRQRLCGFARNHRDIPESDSDQALTAGGLSSRPVLRRCRRHVGASIRFAEPVDVRVGG